MKMIDSPNNQQSYPEDAVSLDHPIQPDREGGQDSDANLNNLLDRIRNLTKSRRDPNTELPETELPVDPSPPRETEPLTAQNTEEFIPIEPVSLRSADLTDSEVEALILKYLLARGDASGRDIADQIKLPFVLTEELLRRLKQDRLIGYRGSASLNDYVCELTDLGRERARRLAAYCSYFGSAPVSLRDYITSVKAQSLEGQHPTEEDLRNAFDDLLISPKIFAKLGPAVNSGRGMFLYGFPGNGKTSIAQRITKVFGHHIWIPRALGVDGEIIRLFDPMSHAESPPEKSDGLLDKSQVDHRWVRIRRPTIIAGGELTMENLEVSSNASTGICESPIQLKSNCGTLVIDDFGRQRIQIDELLNRWIVPLENRVDYLNLPNGKKIQVPFDQLIVFSTNLEPRDLVDEAFLRRIPYKIEICDPSEDDFHELFRMMCPKMGCPYDESAINYLLEKHYRGADRPLRCCHPRDLLLQIRNHCLYEKQPIELNPKTIDLAVEIYFAVM
ncbi:MAG: AAA family ATPase [Planctomycetes bacterium]|nr:AAA family ATPase [Planctomycetota bacterium]